MPLNVFFFFFFNDPATTELSPLSLHDALPICLDPRALRRDPGSGWTGQRGGGAHPRLRPPRHRLGEPRPRSEEHTSELQSRQYLVCRLLLEKKKKNGSTHSQRVLRRVASTPQS